MLLYLKNAKQSSAMRSVSTTAMFSMSVGSSQPNVEQVERF